MDTYCYRKEIWHLFGLTGLNNYWILVLLSIKLCNLCCFIVLLFPVRTLAFLWLFVLFLRSSQNLWLCISTRTNWKSLWPHRAAVDLLEHHWPWSLQVMSSSRDRKRVTQLSMLAVHKRVSSVMLSHVLSREKGAANKMHQSVPEMR